MPPLHRARDRSFDAELMDREGGDLFVGSVGLMGSPRSVVRELRSRGLVTGQVSLVSNAKVECAARSWPLLARRWAVAGGLTACSMRTSVRLCSMSSSTVLPSSKMRRTLRVSSAFELVDDCPRDPPMAALPIPPRFSYHRERVPAAAGVVQRDAGLCVAGLGVFADRGVAAVHRTAVEEAGQGEQPDRGPGCGRQHSGLRRLSHPLTASARSTCVGAWGSTWTNCQSLRMSPGKSRTAQ